MTLKNSLAVCGRMGLQIIRSKWTIPYLVIFPIFFIVIYWFGFSASMIGTTPTFRLGIVNNDEGLPKAFQDVFLNETLIGNDTFIFYHSIDVLEKGFGIELIQMLNSTTYTNHTDSPNIFDVSVYSSISEAEELLIERDLDILMEIPFGFSNASISIFNRYWKNTFGQYFHEMLQIYFPEVPSLPVNVSETVIIQGDDTYINFRLAQSVLASFLENYQDLTSFFEGPGGSINFALNQENQISIPQYSLFDLTIPGLIAFGVLVQPSLLSMLFCMEYRSRNKTIELILLSPSAGTGYLLGSFLIQIPVMFAQTLILFFASILFNFTPQGDVLLAIIISLTIFPFSSSLLYITTAFISNEDIAGTILGFGGPFLCFMSGAFIAVPHISLIPNAFPLAGGFTRDFLIWDLMPLTHSVTALRQVLLYDFNLQQVIPEIFFSLLFGLFYLLVGMITFYYMRFIRRE